MLEIKPKRKNKPGAGPPRLPKSQKRIKLTLTFSPRVMNMIYFLKRKHRGATNGKLMYTTIMEIAVLMLCTMPEQEVQEVLEEHCKNRLMRDRPPKALKPEKETRGRPKKIIENKLNN